MESGSTDLDPLVHVFVLPAVDLSLRFLWNKLDQQWIYANVGNEKSQ